MAMRLVCLPPLLLTPLRAAPRALVPRPQQIRYMERRNAKYQDWRRLQIRMWDALHGFKDGDTMPALEEFWPHA